MLFRKIISVLISVQNTYEVNVLSGQQENSLNAKPGVK